MWFGRGHCATARRQSPFLVALHSRQAFEGGRRFGLELCGRNIEDLDIAFDQCAEQVGEHPIERLLDLPEDFRNEPGSPPSEVILDERRAGVGDDLYPALVARFSEIGPLEREMGDELDLGREVISPIPLVGRNIESKGSVEPGHIRELIGVGHERSGCVARLVLGDGGFVLVAEGGGVGRTKLRCILGYRGFQCARCPLYVAAERHRGFRDCLRERPVLDRSYKPLVGAIERRRERAVQPCAVDVFLLSHDQVTSSL